METYDVIILGGGPAGLTAGIYCGRAGLKVILLEGSRPGGQLAMASRIENYPGYSTTAPVGDLLMAMRSQADKFGANIQSITASRVELSGEIKRVWSIHGQEFQSRAVIIATGATPKMLGLVGEDKYIGNGLSTCAVCDGYFVKDKIVGVVGGGETACEEALYLSSLASHVYMFVRGDKLRAIDIGRVVNNPMITIKYNTEIKGLVGDKSLVAVEAVNNSIPSREVIAMDGLFYAIGLKPNSELFRGQLAIDRDGYIRSVTGIDGVYAAGDVTDYKHKQAIIAAASGANVALEVISYLKSK